MGEGPAHCGWGQPWSWVLKETSQRSQRHQLASRGLSCLFPPWLPSVDCDLKYGSQNKTLSSPSCFCSWCFITAVIDLTKTACIRPQKKNSVLKRRKKKTRQDISTMRIFTGVTWRSLNRTCLASSTTGQSHLLHNACG